MSKFRESIYRAMWLKPLTIYRQFRAMIEFQDCSWFIKEVNERVQSEVLYPAHGDAHPGNRLATGIGWRWIDFEDISLMPKFWDLASCIGNTALFHG